MYEDASGWAGASVWGSRGCRAAEMQGGGDQTVRKVNDAAAGAKQ